MAFVFPPVVILGAGAVGVGGHLNAVGVGRNAAVDEVPSGLVDTIVANGGEGVGIEDGGSEVVVDIGDVDDFRPRSHTKHGTGGLSIPGQIGERLQEGIGHTLADDVGGALGAVAVRAVEGAAGKGHQVAIGRVQTEVHPVRARNGGDAIGDEVQRATGNIGLAVAVHVAVGHHVVVGGGQRRGVGRVGARQWFFIAEVVVVIQVNVHGIVHPRGVGVGHDDGRFFTPHKVAQVVIGVRPYVYHTTGGHAVRNDVVVRDAGDAVIQQGRVGEAGNADTTRAEGRRGAGIHVVRTGVSVGDVGGAKVHIEGIQQHGDGAEDHRPTVVVAVHGAGVDFLRAHQVGVSDIDAIVQHGHGDAGAIEAARPGRFGLVRAGRVDFEPVRRADEFAAVAVGFGVLPVRRAGA